MTARRRRSTTRRLLVLALGIAALLGCEEESDGPPPVDLDDPVIASALDRAEAEGWDPRYDDLYPVDAAPEVLALVTVYGLSLGLPILFALGLLGFALFAYSRKRAADQDARAAEAKEALTPGPTMLHGEVVSVPEGEEAIRLEIRQVGVERRKKNSHTTTWSEIDRRMTTHAFDIALANGQQITVEPAPETTQLADDLSKPEMVGDAERVRRARLEVGETVYASGVLERAVDPTAGFRGASTQLVLRSGGGTMRLSTRPLGEHYGWQVRKAVTWAVLALIVAGLGAWGLHEPYLVVRHAGFSTGTAVIAGKSTEETDDSTYYLVTVVVAESGAVFREALDVPVWRSIQIGDRVPVQYHPDYADDGQLGQRAAMYIGKVFMALLLILGFSIPVLVRRRAGMPWYVRKRLVEKVDGRIPAYGPDQPAA